MESVYNEKCGKGKIKSCNGNINTNFHNDKKPKEGPQYIGLSVILVDSIFRTGKDCYPEVFLEEYKYFGKEKKDAWVYYWPHRNLFWFW